MNQHRSIGNEPGDLPLQASGLVTPSYDPSFILYVKRHWPSKGKVEDFMLLYCEILNFFKDRDQPSLKSYVNSVLNNKDHFYFKDSVPGSEIRELTVVDNLFLILGPWTMMRSYFVPLRGSQRPIAQALGTQGDADPLLQLLPQLIRGCNLLPDSNHSIYQQSRSSGADSILNSDLEHRSSAALIESLSIDVKDLNLLKLTKLAGVKLLWTDNVARHLLLSKRGQKKYLELFALPCTLECIVRDAGTIGISVELIDEIESSYCNLFRPQATSTLHRFANRVLGLRFWCWCLACSSDRLVRRELKKLPRSSNSMVQSGFRRYRTARRMGHSPQDQYSLLVPDSRLVTLMDQEAGWWNKTEFTNLWHRILVLDKCLQEAKPWNFWVLLRDNRDTVQYWTFLFGSVILVLTILQVVLGILQVVEAYSGSGDSK